LTLPPNRKIAIISIAGVQPLYITIIRNIESKNPVVQQITPGVKKIKRF